MLILFSISWPALSLVFFTCLLTGTRWYSSVALIGLPLITKVMGHFFIYLLAILFLFKKHLFICPLPVGLFGLLLNSSHTRHLTLCKANGKSLLLFCRLSWPCWLLPLLNRRVPLWQNQNPTCQLVLLDPCPETTLHSNMFPVSFQQLWVLHLGIWPILSRFLYWMRQDSVFKAALSHWVLAHSFGSG